MAHSIIELHDQSALFHDLDLIVLLGFLKKAVSDSSDTVVRTEVERWCNELRYYTPGAIDIDLEVIHRQRLATAFAELLAKVGAELSGMGDVLPAKVVQSLSPVPELRFKDYPMAGVVGAANRLASLVTSASRSTPSQH